MNNNTTVQKLFKLNQKEVIGAGILLFSIHPITKKIYFLLGNEYSNGYSDFGGKRKHNENVFETANREYCEESLGLKLIPFCNNSKSIYNMLIKGNFLYVIIVNFKKKYICFLKQIPWDNKICNKFSRYRIILLKLKKLADKNYKLIKLIKELPIPGNLIYDKYIINEIIDVNIINNNIKIQLNYIKKFKIRNKLIEFNNNTSELNTNYLNWFKNYKKLIINYENCLIKTHPAIKVRKKNGYIIDLHINQNYLEKSEIKWFSKDEIELLLNDNTPIRYCFIPILKSILIKFKNC